MAISLPVPDEAVYLHESVVRGHHVYKRVWSPVVGEILQLSCEEDNDHVSISVMKAELVVGHVPRRLSRTVWHFLRHCGKAICEVTGSSGMDWKFHASIVLWGKSALYEG